MFDWKEGDRYIHYSTRGELFIGTVSRIVQVQEYEPRLKCKFTNLILVNEKEQQVHADGSKGMVYKISSCNELD